MKKSHVTDVQRDQDKYERETYLKDGLEAPELHLWLSSVLQQANARAAVVGLSLTG